MNTFLAVVAYLACTVLILRTANWLIVCFLRYVRWLWKRSG